MDNLGLDKCLDCLFCHQYRYFGAVPGIQIHDKRDGKTSLQDVTPNNEKPLDVRNEDCMVIFAILRAAATSMNAPDEVHACNSLLLHLQLRMSALFLPISCPRAICSVLGPML